MYLTTLKIILTDEKVSAPNFWAALTVHFINKTIWCQKLFKITNWTCAKFSALEQWIWSMNLKKQINLELKFKFWIFNVIICENPSNKFYSLAKSNIIFLYKKNHFILMYVVYVQFISGFIQRAGFKYEHYCSFSRFKVFEFETIIWANWHIEF